jgi:hypothetical protein
VRYSGIALSYNTASAVLAGTAPLVAAALVKATGWDQSPALYVVGASIVVLVVLAKMRDPSRLEPGLDLAVAPSHLRVDPASAPLPTR